MNGAQSVGQLSQAAQRRGAQPTVEDLEDVLYDILATGVDPGIAPGTLEAVQYLLHEHARKPKTHSELLAFFDSYALSFAKDSARSLGGPLSLPPVLAPHQSAAISGNGQLDHSINAELVRSNNRPLVWISAACLLAILGATLGLAYTSFTNMQAQISQARTQSAQQAQALAQVQAESESLKAGLTETTKVMRSVDQKSELLLQTLVSPLDPAKR